MTRRFRIPPWTWSFGFAAVVLVLIVLTTGRGGPGTLSFALALAPYLVLVGLGQMFVISAGPGNIDVSVGQIVALAGFTSVAATNATSSWFVGLVAGAGTGLAVSVVSVLAIVIIRIPPIVATLASGLIATAFTQTIANGFQGNASPDLRRFLNLAPLGVPVFAVVVIVLAGLCSAVLARTVRGRQLLAVGQAQRAAEYAGIRSTSVIAATYLISGVLSGLAGSLLSAYIAPSVDLGGDYLLDSIAVVVIGGTLISGGRAVPPGVWGGALFFILLDSLLNLVGWNLAGQNVLKGVLVLAVLFLAGGTRLPRRLRAVAETPTTEPSLPTIDDGQPSVESTRS